VGPKAGLDDVENRKSLTLPGLELRPLGRPVRSQSLYRLLYPDFLGVYTLAKIVARPPRYAACERVVFNFKLFKKFMK
jgi:hypothetical protein